MKSIKTKLVLGLCLLIFVVAASIGFFGFYYGYTGMRELQEELLIKKLEGDISASFFYLERHYGTVKVANGRLSDQNGFSLEGRFEMVDAIGRHMGIAATIYGKSNEEFRRITTNVIGEDGIRVIGTFLDQDSLVLESISQGERFIGRATILGRPYLSIYEPIFDANGEVIGIFQIGVAEEESDQLIGTYINKLRNSMVIVSVIGLLIALYITYIISKGIADPIASLSKVIERISNYDLNIDEKKISKYINRKDEIGIITRALEAMQKNLITLVKDISQTSQQVASSSEELTATSQQSATAAEEVARTIEEIAKGATEQAADTEKGVEHVIELGQLIEQDQKHLNNLNISANEVVKLKDEGLTILNSLVEITKVNNKSSKEVQEIIVDTNISAEKIEVASQMIKSIANQTNLLALNAAIEAARAGEAGKGFAVVAEEIRKLAEQSDAFTEEIAKVIKDLTGKTAHAVKTMEAVGRTVAQQTEGVEQTNSKFKGIDASIENMKEVIAEVNSSSKQMEAKKEEIIKIMEGLSAISQQNAAGTEEASASVEEQTASMEEIANASEALARLAEEMQESIAKFNY